MTFYFNFCFSLTSPTTVATKHFVSSFLSGTDPHLPSFPPITTSPIPAFPNRKLDGVQSRGYLNGSLRGPCPPGPSIPRRASTLPPMFNDKPPSRPGQASSRWTPTHHCRYSLSIVPYFFRSVSSLRREHVATHIGPLDGEMVRLFSRFQGKASREWRLTVH